MTPIVCFGGATVDKLYHATLPVRAGTSNPVARREAYGGVARNVAVNLARLGVPARLVSIIGDDANGAGLRRDLEALGVDAEGVAVSARGTTAEYVALLGPDRELAFGLADMAIFDELSAEHVARWLPCGPASAWMFADCNLPAATLGALLGRAGPVKLAVDAVSAVKIGRLPGSLAGVDLLFLNADEAASFLDGPRPEDPATMIPRILERGAGGIVLTLGAGGLLVGDSGGSVHHLPALPAAVVDVTGAGDALVAGTLSRLVQGDGLLDAARVGRRAAALTVAHDGSTRPDLSPALLDGPALARAPADDAGPERRSVP